MSRNFELLQQAGVDLSGGLAGRIEVPFGVAAPGKRAVKARDRAHLASLRPADVGRAAREETLRLVQSVFLLRETGEEGRAVVFASVNPRGGCSRVCAQAAQVLAESVPGSVCMVDANFRGPSLSRAFSAANNYGLTDALRTSEPIRSYARVVRGQNLWLISCGSGTQQTLGLLHSDHAKQRMDDLRKEFNYILIDAPPLNSYSEGVALGQFSDGLVLVLEANSTRRDASCRIAERLRAMQVNILGAVLNKRTFPIPDMLYRCL